MRKVAGLFAILLSISAAFAFQARPKTSRFDPKVVDDPAQALDVVALPAASLPAASRAGWDAFKSAHGSSWTAHVDRRTGAPLLAEGAGILWKVDTRSTVDTLAASLREFVSAHRGLLIADDTELVLDHDASGLLTEKVWQIVFTRAIAGVPVTGERYVFTIGYGNLTAFGASRWSRIDVSPFPDIDAAEALIRLRSYLELSAEDDVSVFDKGTLLINPAREGASLVWRVVIRVTGEPGTWQALVDAHTGAIRAFEDINDYGHVKGGVYPISNDGADPDGIEQPGYPMPFANVTIGGSTAASSSTGLFACTPGGAAATTSLAGPYLRVVDICGTVSQSVTCDADLDLQQGPGTDCAVPPGASNGNTHAARSSFYHLNRIAEHARAWLPTRSWLFNQLTNNVNLNQTCNAYWLPANGTVNFFKSGNGCANTGEIAGIFLHEWGHGLDHNDGGFPDNPSEAYADITAMLATHSSCVGRGFQQVNCTGYGDFCLSCTGIREQDWAQHTSNTPATPAGFVASRCAFGGGPCGREVHCEAHVAAQALWDLAVRDLPASGLDPASAWQITERLWYRSRLGSGGNAYNCSLPSSDGCSATSWFTKLRTVDDDDGNLANGTPHAAAIFAAFDRHAIACGAAGDASNQSSTICPALIAPVLTASAGVEAAQLSWTTIPGGAFYKVLRSDASCDTGSTIIASLTPRNYLDTGLANGFPQYYRVQATGTNPACVGPVSNCVAVIPQPYAGIVTFGAPSYSCASTVTVTVNDGNIAGNTTTAIVTSPGEPAGESITLSRIAPGSGIYRGTLLTTAGPAAVDGKISVADGATITATYVDADDGTGGINLSRQSAAGIDCILPAIANVQANGVTGISAQITWDTSEPATSVVHYGLAPPPGGTASLTSQLVSHTVDLTGLSECSTYVYSVESADAVGNAAIDSAGGAYYTFATLKNTTPSFASPDTPLAIPDDDPAGATSTIDVAANKTVVGVKVKLHVTHSYDGELVLTLLPPSGPPVTLASLRGGSSNNFIDTVFDDAAATPISGGAAPFTGSFRPETPLSSATGINAAGAWRLKVVDTSGTDVGLIDGWTLTLTYPPADCGPHAMYQAHVRLSDICSTGGPGNADTVWDAGERVTFRLDLNNDGTTPLSGIIATVTPTTPGVVMLDGSAGFPNLATGTIASSIAPHFTAYLPPGLACGSSTVSFDVEIESDQGTWGGDSFSHGVGLVVPATGSPVNESFAAGIPADWTVLDGGLGGGAAATWTAANPGGRSIDAPMAAPVVTVDSDAAGDTGATQDEQLLTPFMSFEGATSVTLDFDHYFRWYVNNLSEVGDVDVRSTVTGGNWVNVLRLQGDSSPNPDHRTIDISALAAGAGAVQVRFHYFNGRFEWYWQVDNVRVSYAGPGSCSQHVCVPSAVGAKAVPDGTFGNPMRPSRANAPGSSINLTWDVSACASLDYHVLYGNLASVATSSIFGSVCNLGTSGAATWAGVPSGSLWFVVVGDDNVSTEGSWGMMTAGQRGGTVASGQCGATTRNNQSTCP